MVFPSAVEAVWINPGPSRVENITINQYTPDLPADPILEGSQRQVGQTSPNSIVWWVCVGMVFFKVWVGDFWTLLRTLIHDVFRLDCLGGHFEPPDPPPPDPDFNDLNHDHKNACTWISMDVHAKPWISIDIYTFP